MSGRFGATIEQVGKDLTTGIEGDDLITDSLRAVRNVAIGTWHAVSGIVPSIANSFNGQPYSVVQRETAYQGTSNAFGKVIHTKGVFGKASAVLAEATEGPVDDALAALTGGAQYIIVPQTRSSLKNIMESTDHKHVQLAA